MGINGMSYHWWSPSALLSAPGKQIYGIYKYVFLKTLEPQIVSSFLTIQE